jgi:hypothetical protein
MIRRTTWIVLAIFVGLLGLAWYLQRTQGEATASETPTPGVQPLYSLADESVAGLTVTDAQENVVALERGEEGEWTLLEPAEPVDLNKAQAAVDTLLSMNILSKPEPAPAIDAVGLTTPAYTIVLTSNDGEQITTTVGKTTPTGSGYYVQIDGGPIYVVSQFGMDSVTGLVANPPVAATATPEATATAGGETSIPETGTPAP